MILSCDMSHSVSSEVVMYFGPSSQKSISQQICLVIMHIYFFFFQKVGGLIQNLNRFLLGGPPFKTTAF